MPANILPTQLRCEYLENPISIETLHPRLSWSLEAVDPNLRGLRQNAYHILVASTPELLSQHTGDLWDSSKVSSAQSTHIAYAGTTLTTRQPCWWQVCVWDADDNQSEYSSPAHWEMGLLTPDDWQAQWLSLDIPAAQLQNLDEVDAHLLADRIQLMPSPYLRTTATLAQPVQRARLYITARGLYEAHINGQRIGDSYFAPGWTDYNKRIQYQTYDVTAHLQQGENAIGAILGPGWYCGHVGFISDNGGCKHYGPQPQLLLQLHIDYVDGSHEVITSNENWQGSAGPIIFSDFLAGETYDARRELNGWDQPDFAATAWHPVTTTDRDAVPLVSEPSEPVLVTETLKPRSLKEVSPGTHIFDMGQNMVGFVQLHVQGPASTRVQLRFAEMLNPDGTLYTTNLRSARQTDTYILNGSGQETFTPHFTFHGFRYVELTGFPGQPTLDTITALVTHSATPPTGTFTCSNPIVNQLQQNILWGQRGNFLSVPTDCPQRDERLGWMGDAQIFVRTACYNMNVAAFFTKWLNDVEDAQSPEGGFSDVAPRLVVTNDAAPAWGDAGIIVPWTIYQMYGDTRVLEQHYTAMTRWIAYIHEANPDLLWKNRRNNDYGDWLSIEADTPKDVLATAYFAYDALLLSQIATALGRHSDASKYQDLHRDISAAFCKAYVSSDGRIAGNTQTCYVIALHMQLLPEELRPLAAQYLVEDIEKKGGHLSTGFVGVGYLCPVLTEAGYTDIAYRLLNNDTFPSWGYSIKHGATTIWERWDGWTEDKGFQDPGMNSFNHYSLGSVGQWLYQYVAGLNVDPASPGFQHTIIRPYPGGGLTSARANYHTLYGLLSSHWEQDGNTFTLRVTIPPNTTAAVYIPALTKDHVREGNQPASEATGVTYLSKEEGRILFAVTSGTYTFITTTA